MYARRADDAEAVARAVAQLKPVRAALESEPASPATHCWPCREVVETEKAVYLLRPYGFCSVRERLSTRPFLAPAERAWVAFQMLAAVAECHSKGVPHGDIKLENVLVTR